MTDITAILTCHHEGLLLGPSLGSFFECVGHARQAGLAVECLIILDRGDRLTRAVAQQATDARLLETDLGDPGQSRNAGVAAAQGKLVAFLDGDDLWSFNWLSEAAAFSARQGKPTVCHSEFNIVFGDMRQTWWHADSEDPAFDRDYLRIGNYWDAMCLAPRALMRKYPFTRNDLPAGFGHEDWHWNLVTYGAGVAHRPVPGTVHFKRRRPGSQMEKCAIQDVVPHPTPLASFDWQPPQAPVGRRARLENVR